MDKATDLCETKGFLQKSVLEELNNYLDDKDNDIIINFPKYYIDNTNTDLFMWYNYIIKIFYFIFYINNKYLN